MRIGLHAGEAQERGGDWFGPALNRTARLMAVGHGGQVLVSGAAAALVGDAPAGGVALVDLGMHRLRDLAQPEHVFQVRAAGLRETFPPLRALDAFKGNLPTELTSFLGREADVEAVVGEVTGRSTAGAGHRLVTLTGPGGVGKTRLALQVAADAVPDFPDGAFLCELANITAPEAVEHAVLAALGFVVRPGASARTSLLEALAERHLLLLVDNCEHLRAPVADLVEAILREATRVHVLATSREPLAVAGERTWAVDPLPIETDAVALFAERAEDSRRDFTLGPANQDTIAEICRHLDGVPLAIELAAARIRSMTPDDLLARLGDRFRVLSAGRQAGRPERQATLRATLDWSYDLLSVAERDLFDRLSVFVGGFDLETACAVAAEPGADDLEVLDLLASLVDKSLVRLETTEGGSRYGMLETMRQYGAERLAADGLSGSADDPARRHAEHFARFAEQAAAGLRGRDEASWVERIDADFDNLRAAARWAIDHRDVDLAARLAGSLWSLPIDADEPRTGRMGRGRACAERDREPSDGRADPHHRRLGSAAERSLRRGPSPRRAGRAAGRGVRSPRLLDGARARGLGRLLSRPCRPCAGSRRCRPLGRSSVR